MELRRPGRPAHSSTGVRRERRRALAILVTFAVAPLLFFTFGTTSLHAYVPPVIQPRYFAPVVAPGAIAVVAGLWWMSPRPRIAIAASIAFVALVAVQGLASNLATRGSVYASAYKTSLAEARADLGARYPGLPIVDAPGGRADLARCRKILAEAPHLSDDLVRGRLVYDAAALAPPFIVLGPRGFMDLEHPFVARLRSGTGEGLWSPELVGSSAPAPASTAKPTDDVFALEAVLFSAPRSSGRGARDVPRGEAPPALARGRPTAGPQAGRRPPGPEPADEGDHRRPTDGAAATAAPRCAKISP